MIWEKSVVEKPMISLQEDELLNVEEGTLDLANAAPGNKGRERVTDQVRIRILVQLGLG